MNTSRLITICYFCTKKRGRQTACKWKRHPAPDLHEVEIKNMQTTLFYQTVVSEGFITLSEEDSRHCIKVLRMKTGDHANVTDGRGNLYKTRIAEANPKATKLEVFETLSRHPSHHFRIHMAVAPTKNISRFEWFLEKATEIGIDEITPLICHNSERTVLKLARLEKVVIAAMKQSQQYWLPEIHEPVQFGQFISSPFTGSGYIAYIGDIAQQSLIEAYKPATDATILIGPEGDFTQEEVKEAINAGFEAIHLGTSRLRTETAALIACHTLHVLNRI